MKVIGVFGAALIATCVTSAMAGPGDINPDLTISGEAHPTDPQSWIFNVTQGDVYQVAVMCREDRIRGERLVASGTHRVQQQIIVRGLKADTTYECVARYPYRKMSPSAPVTITTDPLPEDLVVPRVTVRRQSPAATGYTIFNLGNMYYDGDLLTEFDPEQLYTDSNYLAIIDADGNVRWYLEGPGAGDIEVSYLGNNRILYSGQGVPEAYPPTIVGLDKQIRLQATQQRLSSIEFGNEFGLYYNHEANLSEDRSSIFTFIHTRRPDGMMGFSIREIAIADADGDGVMEQVKWVWDSFQAAEDGQLDLYSELNELDPLHPNAISNEVGEDGRLYVYVSLRSPSKILKIDYETKDIVWQLSYESDDWTLLNQDGTPADEDDWFFNQHDVKVGNGIITMYDNGMDRYLVNGIPGSRALTLELDETNRIVRILNEYSEPRWLEPAWGSYDILDNGHQLIAQGHCGFCGIPGTKPSAFLELDRRDNVVWRAQYGQNEKDHMIYRAKRIDGCDLFGNLRYCPRLGKIWSDEAGVMEGQSDAQDDGGTTDSDGSTGQH